MMTTTTISEKKHNPFTSKHEPFGMMVQSQGDRKYMILSNREGSWKRIVWDLPYYCDACNMADQIASLL